MKKPRFFCCNLVVIFLSIFICAATLVQDVKIMFLGDSYIEQDWGGGFKPYIYNFFKILNYNVKFVGRSYEGASGEYFSGAPATEYLDFDWPLEARAHEGVTGKTAEAYAMIGSEDVTTALRANPPNIININLNLNDVASGFTASQIVANDGKIVRQIWAFDPNIKIVWNGMAKTQACQSNWYTSIETTNALLQDSIAKWSQSGWIKFVNVDSALNETTDFYSDGHPSNSYGLDRNDGGYYHLAQVIEPILKEAVEDIILPVELTSFTTVLHGTTALLNWSTATEVNNNGFEIERRAAGSSAWTKVGFVPGAGTSNSPKSYLFEDAQLAPGAYVYRIKQIDNNGAFEYSASTQVDAGVSNALQLGGNYPNPFNPTTNIQFSVPENGYASLKVYNMLGQEVATLFSGMATAGHYIPATFNASRLASGIYFARLQYNGKSLVQRMLMTK
jgi:hypothetical protein